MSYMLLLFFFKLVKLKIVWLARILGIVLFGDGGSNLYQTTLVQRVADPKTDQSVLPIMQIEAIWCGLNNKRVEILLIVINRYKKEHKWRYHFEVLKQI
jgi:hypothetical protein